MAAGGRLVARPRLGEDLARLAEVLSEVHGTDGYPVEGVDDPMGWLESRLMLAAWVVVVDGEPAGHVMVTSPGPGDDAARLWAERHAQPTSDVVVVCRLFVAPAVRGLGAGAALVGAATEYAQASSRAAVLDVMDKDRAAVALYERLGWRPRGGFEHRHAGGVEPATGVEWGTMAEGQTGRLGDERSDSAPITIGGQANPRRLRRPHHIGVEGPRRRSDSGQ